MDSRNDPLGSVWRKWDLHIHTPASFHWSGGKRFCQMTEGEKAAALEEMINAVSKSGVAAFGIMDYWTFDGYWALRDYLASTGWANDQIMSRNS
jgi:predicted metal-dependent phosphoesterase TrpH